ncbi:MAG: DUF2905 domain-containing protein [bacterium]|nr:DUF2905 domain-containing protein [bacterium]
MTNIAKILILIGTFLILFGGVTLILGKIGFSKLPGDIRIQHENFSFYFPITSCILLSAVITLILSLFLRK